MELAVPFLIGLYKRMVQQCACILWCENLYDWATGKDSVPKEFTRPEREYAQAPFDTSAEVINDFMEISIQFGYVCVCVCVTAG